MNADTALFRLINIAWGWEPLAPFMHFMSKLEYFIPVIVVLVAWLLVRGGAKGRITVLMLVLLITASDQISSHLIKPMVGRPRPCRPEAGIEGVKTHGARCSSRGSFPSSHAANIAAAVFLLLWRHRRGVIVGIVLVFLVGYSRIYLGVHYPLDVLAGWSLGCLLAAAGALLAAAGDRWWIARKRPAIGQT